MKKGRKNIPVAELHARAMKTPSYAKAYVDLEEEFALASALIEGAREQTSRKNNWQSEWAPRKP